MTFHARDPQRRIRGSGLPEEAADAADLDEQAAAPEPAGSSGPEPAPEQAAVAPEPEQAAAPEPERAAVALEPERAAVALEPAPDAPPRPSFAPQSKVGAAWGSGTFTPLPEAPPLPVAAPAPATPLPEAPPLPVAAPAPLPVAAPAPLPVAAPAHPLPPAPAAAAPLPVDIDDEPEDAPLPRPTFRELIRRITPAMAILTIGSVGSALFLLRAMTSHTTPIAVLMSAGVVTALVFALDTVILTAATYRESRTGESGRSLALALLGGISAVICALALAGTLILMLVLNS
jgi:hypothetical protein